MEIQHFSHEKHPLFLKDDKTADQKIRKCGICRSNIAVPFYACDLCGYYLHKSCAELPRLLNHSFHASHPLHMGYNEGKYYCRSCHREFSHSLAFSCTKCDFYMDVECATMPSITFTEVDQSNIIQHFSHQHPMPFVKIESKDEINCFGCQSIICSDDQVYGCTKCKYFLHKSCAELPKQIQYPKHWKHGLFDLLISYSERQCRLCGKNLKTSFTFECRICRFDICVKCCPVRGTFQYDYHEHLLDFAEEINLFLGQCNSYDSYCKRPLVSHCGELYYTSSCGFFCLECDFKVHLLCGPLPSMIKYENHIHSLILTDSLNDDNDRECCCDVCEMERDLRIRVYYCQQCKYTADVHCVTPEIIKIIKGDLRDVKFKSLGEDHFWKTDSALLTADDQHDQQQLKSTPLTLNDLINALSEREKGKLNVYYKWDYDVSIFHVMELGQPEECKLGDEDIIQILQLSRFTHNDFANFFKELEKFNSNTRFKLKSSDLGLKIVTSVKGYMIPLILEPVLKTLIAKYGDVSPKGITWFSPKGITWFSTIEGKSMVYFILCAVVKGMCRTKVGDITKNLLQEWFYHLTFVKTQGKFEIDFAVAHLERLVRAFFGHQANKLQDEIPAMLNKKTAKLEKEMAKLEEEIGEVKSNLKRCQEYGGSSTKSEFMKECLEEASQLKWKDACEGLL